MVTVNRLELRGLVGSNPLAFLAAVGTLRTLHLAWPNEHVQMHWVRANGWNPVLSAQRALDKDLVVQTLDEQLRRMRNHKALSIDDDLTIAPKDFRRYAEEAIQEAQLNNADRTWVDFVAAFGCDALAEDDLIQDTAFRTMSGAGHQHFLRTMVKLVDATAPEHLEKSLFQPWAYDDEGPSMRWDPEDDRRYALRWSEPSRDPIRTVRGANRLAIEALPLFPTAPVGAILQTTGFRTGGNRATFFTWPIWAQPISLDVVRTVLALGELQRDAPDRRQLAQRGIVEVYRSQRVTVGKYRNFTPAEAI